MYQLTQTLWVGHIGDARDFHVIHAAEIAALIDLAANEPPLNPPRDLIYCRFPLIDGPGNESWLLRSAVDVVARLLRARVSTLIFCSAGMSRSVAVAAAALATVHDTSIESEMKRLAGIIKSDVSPGLWNDLRATLSNRAIE
jgi:protein-tyrosine phosphatase